MTAEAAEAVSACDVIVGYTVYVELIRTSWPEKYFYHPHETGNRPVPKVL